MSGTLRRAGEFWSKSQPKARWSVDTDSPLPETENWIVWKCWQVLGISSGEVEENRNFAEFERDLIRERTGAGREAAKKRGVRFGRLRKLNSDREQLVRRLLDEGKPLGELAKTFEVQIATIYRLSAAVA